MFHLPFLRIGLVLTGLAAFVSCHSKEAPFYSDGNELIENGQLSLTVSRREVASSRDGLLGRTHTSDESEDYWRVFWNLADLRDSGPNLPARTAYLGHYEAHFDAKGLFGRKNQGLDLGNSDYTGDMHVLVWKASQMLSPKLPLTEPSALWGQMPWDKGRTTLLSRSRKTLFVWSPAPALFDARSLSQVRALPLTETFTKFRKLAEKSTAMHRTVLTDNLRFLIAVPHNGGESPQGSNHYKAGAMTLSMTSSSSTGFTSASRPPALTRSNASKAAFSSWWEMETARKRS